MYGSPVSYGVVFKPIRVLPRNTDTRKPPLFRQLQAKVLNLESEDQYHSECYFGTSHSALAVTGGQLYDSVNLHFVSREKGSGIDK